MRFPMRRIALRRSPGADVFRALCLVLAVLAPQAVSAQDYADGQAAYASRDWAAAEVLWRHEAATGSADAMLGLGNLYDFGLLGDPDPERALELYQQAADLGLAEAAFNVGVMHDSGIGIPRDPQVAAAWYSFAALDGHSRAAYNLGQMFSGGTDLPRNDALAAFWLDRAAAAIPSARDALADLPPFGLQVDAPSVPTPLAIRILTLPTGPKARMAWVDAASPADARYRVDLIRMSPEGSSRIASGETTGSAISVDLPAAEGGVEGGVEGGAEGGAEGGVVWRVAQIAGSAYAASGWQTHAGGPIEEQPIGTVRFEFAQGDRRAEGLAFRMGGAMARFGAIVEYAPTEGEAAVSGVSYGFAQDAGLAEDVSAFVPGEGPEMAALESSPDAFPGEVKVTLAFEEAVR